MKAMNIQEALIDIHEHGYTQPELAEMFECNQSTISRVLYGQEPKYYLGKKIEILHREIYPNGKKKKVRSRSDT